MVLVLHIVIESYRLACGVMCGVLRLSGDMHAVRLPHSWEPHIVIRYPVGRIVCAFWTEHGSDL
jgi:hypothetical protein